VGKYIRRRPQGLKPQIFPQAFIAALKALRHPKAPRPQGLKPQIFLQAFIAAMKAPPPKSSSLAGAKAQILFLDFYAALKALRHPKAFAAVQAPTLTGFSR
jgi:hypothetical protein